MLGAWQAGNVVVGDMVEDGCRPQIARWKLDSYAKHREAEREK
jgi:hypothetical protein